MAVRLSSGRRNGCGASRNERVTEVRVDGEGRGEGVDEQEGLAPGRSGITGAVEGFVTRSRAASGFQKDLWLHVECLWVRVVAREGAGQRKSGQT